MRGIRVLSFEVRPQLTAGAEAAVEAAATDDGVCSRMHRDEKGEEEERVRAAARRAARGRKARLAARLHAG